MASLLSYGTGILAGDIGQDLSPSAGQGSLSAWNAVDFPGEPRPWPSSSAGPHAGPAERGLSGGCADKGEEGGNSPENSRSLSLSLSLSAGGGAGERQASGENARQLGLFISLVTQGERPQQGERPGQGERPEQGERPGRDERPGQGASAEAPRELGPHAEGEAPRELGPQAEGEAPRELGPQGPHRAAAHGPERPLPHHQQQPPCVEQEARPSYLSAWHPAERPLGVRGGESKRARACGEAVGRPEAGDLGGRLEELGGGPGAGDVDRAGEGLACGGAGGRPGPGADRTRHHRQAALEQRRRGMRRMLGVESPGSVSQGTSPSSSASAHLPHSVLNLSCTALQADALVLAALHAPFHFQRSSHEEQARDEAASQNPAEHPHAAAEGDPGREHGQNASEAAEGDPGREHGLNRLESAGGDPGRARGLNASGSGEAVVVRLVESIMCTPRGILPPVLPLDRHMMAALHSRKVVPCASAAQRIRNTLHSHRAFPLHLAPRGGCAFPLPLAPRGGCSAS